MFPVQCASDTKMNRSSAQPFRARAGACTALLLVLGAVAPLAFTQSSQSPGKPTAGAQTQDASSSSAAEADPRKAREAYQQGIRAERVKDWETAYAAYTDASNWAPDEREYALRRAIARSRLVQEKVDAAEREAVAGKFDAAIKELTAASFLDPTNGVIRERLAELAAAEPGQARTKVEADIGGPMHLDYREGKRTFDFRGDTQGLYNEIARQFGIEAAFDVDLTPRRVGFRFEEVDFLTAMRLAGDMTNTFWRPITSRLFFVAQDTPEKRKDYEPSVMRTILLPASNTPAQMTETFRVVRDISGVTRSDLDTRSRTITLRASPRAIAVATDLIGELEKPAGELILEIEILEVDRNRAQQLGITPPETAKVFTLSSQEIQEAEQSQAGLITAIEQVFGLPSSLSGLTTSQIQSLLNSGQIGLGTFIPPLVAFGGGKSTFLATLPGAAANFSQMLSLVRHGRRILLRAQDGQPATFFVGDRIPVTLATYSASFSGLGANVPNVVSSNFPTTNYPVGTAPAFVATAILRAGSSVNDLVTANSSDNTVSVLLGNGDGTFAAQVAYPLVATTDKDPVGIATGEFDVNNNADTDLAVVNSGSNNVSILLGDGTGNFTPKVDVPVGNTPVSVVTADFHDLTANHPLDLAVANQADNTISILEGNGDGTFKPAAANTPALIQLPAGFAPAGLAVADLNNDGHMDLVVADKGNNSVSVFLGKGDGTFNPRTDYPVGNAPVWVSAGDFTGDGFTDDLAVANSGAPTSALTGNSVSILLAQKSTNGTPLGTFGTQTAYPAGNLPTSIAVADYNLDGEADLAVSDQSDNAVSILLNIGGGAFSPNFEIPVGTGPVSIVTADFNGTGKPDVATANNGSNDVSVILNSSTFTGFGNGISGTPFPGVEYLDVGLKVKATPRIHPDDVTLQLDFDISSLTSQSFNSIPVISSETVDQTVRVKENETAALAGFRQAQLTNAITGTPGIAELPGVGYLAGNQNAQSQETELLILVTPRQVRLALRADHVVYAGKGSIEGPAGAATPTGPFAPVQQEQPPQAQPQPGQTQTPQPPPQAQPQPEQPQTQQPPPQTPGAAPPEGAQPEQPNEGERPNRRD